MAKLLYLSEAAVRASGVGMRAIMEAVRAAFVAKGQGRAQAPPKTALYPLGDGFLNAMPASLPGMAGLKWVSAYPGNAQHGLPNVSALIVLNDVATGRPLSVMDGRWITARRTGALSGLCAGLMTPRERPTAAILGCGVQGRTNLEALMLGCPLGGLWAYDIDPAARARYASEARAAYPGLEVLEANSVREAAEPADIIITAGPIRRHPRPSLEVSMLKQGLLGLPLDYDSYWPAAAINACQRFWVDDLEQYSQLGGHGYFAGLRRPDGDLGEIFLGSKVGREDPLQRVLVMSLGLGITDLACATLVYQAARQQGLGHELPF